MAETGFDRVSLAGRKILITGAGSGIGQATAEICAARGASVMIADLNSDAGKQVAAGIRDRGLVAEFVTADVSSEDDVIAAVRATVDAFGGLDGAFNNAALNRRPGEVGTLLADVGADYWNDTIAVNLTGVLLCLKHEIRYMLEHGGGSIVNTSSSAGIVSVPANGPYIAAKHGVMGLTKSASQDYSAEGIRVNAVLPAAIETPRLDLALQNETLRAAMLVGHPIGRYGQAHEVGETAAWLLSDAASFITGVGIPVDGGYTSV
jgi:2,5-dichloro-2,5-cyclohexadiene-1,4-diol dehydrogenase 1